MMSSDEITEALAGLAVSVIAGLVILAVVAALLGAWRL